MRYSTQVKPISYLKAHAAEVLVQLAECREPLVITQNGEAKAVLQDVASFEETQETLALLKILDKAPEAALARGRRSGGRVPPAGSGRPLPARRGCRARPRAGVATALRGHLGAR